MALTPLDIQNKTFTKQMRGFSVQEVDEFLDEVTKDYSALLRQNRDYEKNIKHLEEKLRYFNELKEALNQSIIVAQETADQVKDSAQKEAEVIVSDANTESSELLLRTKKEAADMIADAKAKSEKLVKDATERANFLINDATAKANSLAQETNDLKKKARSFHQRMMLLLESQLEVTKSDEWEELLQPFSSYVTEEHQNFKNAVSLDKIESGNTEEPAPGTVPAMESPAALENDKGEFLGQTMALDRKQLTEAIEKANQAKEEASKAIEKADQAKEEVSEVKEDKKVTDTSEDNKELTIELPKLERRKK